MGNVEATAAPQERKRCYVAMGYGKKVDYETGRTLDLDKTYRNIIKPTVEQKGLECIRADEIPHSGIIDVPMYRLLLEADLVIVDLSARNANAVYELGVRHALRPNATIVMAEDAAKFFMFDVNHLRIIQYHHMGDGIDYEEIMRCREALGQAIDKLLNQDPLPVDSPVYQFIPSLRPPSFGEGAADSSNECRPAASPAPAAAPAAAPPMPPVLEPSPESRELARLTGEVEAAALQGLDADVRTLLASVLKRLPSLLKSGPLVNAPDLIQRLVSAACAVGGPMRPAALTDARRVFEFITPARSNDPETLRLLGDLELAMFEENNDMNRLRRAREAYDRLYKIKRDYRSGITLAYVVTLQAENQKDVSEKLTDIGDAQRLRREVIEACKAKLARIDERLRTESTLKADEGLAWTEEMEEAAKNRLEVWGALAEAYYGLGDLDNYRAALDEASFVQVDLPVTNAVEERVTRLAPYLRRQSQLLASVKEYVERMFDRANDPPPSSPPPGWRAAPPPPRAAPPRRDLIFFSYAHNEKDSKLLNEIQKTLAPSFRNRDVRLWDDRQIEAGQKWRDAIEDALSRAKAAVLLVSREFLNSEFISDTELPALLKGAEEEGVKMLWVAVEKSLVADTEVIEYQALNNPEQPLSGLDEKAYGDEIFSICEKIRDAVLPKTK